MYFFKRLDDAEVPIRWRKAIQRAVRPAIVVMLDEARDFLDRLLLGDEELLVDQLAVDALVKRLDFAAGLRVMGSRLNVLDFEFLQQLFKLRDPAPVLELRP